MINEFLVYYDFIASFAAKGLESSEILTFLNNAQDEFIKERAFGKGFQPPALDDNEKRVADLFPLVSQSTITTGITVNTLYGNSWYCPKNGVESGRVRFTVKIDARLRRTEPIVTDQFIECEKIRIENTGKFVISGINRPYFLKPKYIEQSGGYYLLGDYYTTLIDQLRVACIRKPYLITNSTLEYSGTYENGVMSLHPDTHAEIIKLAVREALQVNQDPRWQTAVNESQIKTS